VEIHRELSVRKTWVVKAISVCAKIQESHFLCIHRQSTFSCCRVAAAPRRDTHVLGLLGMF
jgi:hypothetical protein